MGRGQQSSLILWKVSPFSLTLLCPQHVSVERPRVAGTALDVHGVWRLGEPGSADMLENEPAYSSQQHLKMVNQVKMVKQVKTMTQPLPCPLCCRHEIQGRRDQPDAVGCAYLATLPPLGRRGRRGRG